MIDLQLFTGMRPGEVCGIRPVAGGQALNDLAVTGIVDDDFISGRAGRELFALRIEAELIQKRIRPKSADVSARRRVVDDNLSSRRDRQRAGGRSSTGARGSSA